MATPNRRRTKRVGLPEPIPIVTCADAGSVHLRSYLELSSPYIRNLDRDTRPLYFPIGEDRFRLVLRAGSNHSGIANSKTVLPKVNFGPPTLT